LLRAAAWLIPLGVLLNVGVALLTVEFHTFRELGRVTPAAVAVVCALALLPWATQSLRIAIWTRFVGNPISIRGGVRIVAGGVLGSAVTPTAVGGGTIRWALATRYGLPPGRAASLLAVEAVEDLAFFAVALPAALLLSSGDEGEALRRAATSPARSLDDPVWAALGGALGIGALLATVAWLGFRGQWGAGPRRWTRRLAARLRAPLRRTLADARGVLVDVARRGKGWLAVSLSLTAVQWIARYSMATVVISLIGGPLRPYLFWVLGWMTYAVSSAVPTPGAAGAAEATFYVLHAPWVEPQVLVVATAAWRLLLFYLPALVAVVLFPVLGAAERRRGSAPPPLAPEAGDGSLAALGPLPEECPSSVGSGD